LPMSAPFAATAASVVASRVEILARASISVGKGWGV